MASMYKGKRILVVGGTGTIGQHLVRVLLKEEPAVIRVFSRDEHKQFEMQQELQEYQSTMRYLIGDVRDISRLNRAIEDIDYVFHLAAMKHVPACEYNPFEAVQTNINGTQNIIQAALQAGVQKVLFTSSDKAVSPTNTYGATKLMGERLISAAQFQRGPRPIVFASVRFGNVMGSRGSVIPLFKKQILEKSKLTVTDRRMTRYMMTPHQAITLLLKANELSKGGEVFVLKMPIVKLSDLMETVAEELSKTHRLDRSIKIEEIGLRPGEKMDEELMTADEASKVIETDYMYIIPPISGSVSKEYGTGSIGMSEDITYKHNEVISKEKLREWLVNENLV